MLERTRLFRPKRMPRRISSQFRDLGRQDCECSFRRVWVSTDGRVRVVAVQLRYGCDQHRPGPVRWHVLIDDGMGGWRHLSPACAAAYERSPRRAFDAALAAIGAGQKPQKEVTTK